jgi:hypothetical protein
MVRRDARHILEQPPNVRIWGSFLLCDYFVTLNRLGCEIHSKTCRWDDESDSCKDGAYCPTFNGKKYTCIDIEYDILIKLEFMLVLELYEAVIFVLFFV